MMRVQWMGLLLTGMLVVGCQGKPKDPPREVADKTPPTEVEAKRPVTKPKDVAPAPDPTPVNPDPSPIAPKIVGDPNAPVGQAPSGDVLLNNVKTSLAAQGQKDVVMLGNSAPKVVVTRIVNAFPQLSMRIVYTHRPVGAAGKKAPVKNDLVIVFGRDWMIRSSIDTSFVRAQAMQFGDNATLDWLKETDALAK